MKIRILLPPPINSKIILTFENLFASSERAANETLVSNFLDKHADDKYLLGFAL